VGHALCNSGVIVPPPTAFSGAGMGWQGSVGNEPDHVVQGDTFARHLAAQRLAILDFLRPNGNAEITKMVFCHPLIISQVGGFLLHKFIFYKTGNNQFFIFHILP